MKISIRLTVFLVLAAVLIGAGVDRALPGDRLAEELAKYRDVLTYVQRYYVDEVDWQKVNQGAIEGALAALDPHSNYLAPADNEADAEEFDGSYEGVGMEIASIKDTVVIVEPFGGGPAAAVGLHANDRIIGIDDSSAVGLPTGKVTNKLRGKSGSKVRLTVVRNTVRKPMIFEITRGSVPVSCIDAAVMLPGGIGYVSVNRFSLFSYPEVAGALSKLRGEGMQKIILDLRGNPGGYLEEAVQVADLFLDGGTGDAPRTIVYTRGRVSSLEESFTATTGQDYEKTPLIVLINNASASASEILSGAMQDWDRGLIVGESSFGKGLVQRQWELADGSAIRLTVSRYYTPSGRLIQRPYEGKDRRQYDQEAFARSEKEGENIGHAQDLAAASASPSAQPPRGFKTAGGRAVYGGGGITPDYIVKPLELTDFTRMLIARDLFYPYAVGWIDRLGEEKPQALASMPAFCRNFQVTDRMLADFHAYLEREHVTIDEASFLKDAHYTKVRLKATIARGFWWEEGWSSVMLEVDPQLQKALTLFPKAEEIARLEKHAGLN